jgi:hypothetical protein
MIDPVTHQASIQLKKHDLQIPSLATEEAISAGDFREKSGRTAKTISAHAG